MGNRLIKTCKIILFGIGCYLWVVALTPIMQFIGLLKYVKRATKEVWR